MQTFWEFISVETSLVDRGIFFFPLPFESQGFEGFQAPGLQPFCPHFVSQGSQAPGLPPVLGGWLVSYVWGCLVFGVLYGSVRA